MKTKAEILFAIYCSLLFASCEKVVQIDLNTANPTMIVEGNVTNLPGPYTILLSHSVNYYDANIFPAVEGANVSITDNAGNAETLQEVAPGKYQTSLLQGTPGNSYTLKINADSKEYIGNSNMPQAVAIDSVNLTPNNRGDGFRVICKFQDPPGMQNFYKLQLSSNDTAAFDSTSIRIVADGFADGQELSLTYRTHLLIGDSLLVKLESIDKSTYDFYRTLPNVEGGIRTLLSAPPANPVSNVNNGAIGYFSAHSISTKLIVVQ